MRERGIHMVLGMHRSGTSLVAGLLHLSGVMMGEPGRFKPRPNLENPKGFFENWDFRVLNDRILEYSGYVVKSWNPRIGRVKAHLFHRLRMYQLIRRYQRSYLQWGWKDPRQMLTCGIWFEALRELGVLSNLRVYYVYRHPLSVAKSLMKRNNVMTISHGVALWYTYNLRALTCLEEEQIPYYVLSMEEIVAHPKEAIPMLARYGGIEIRRETWEQFISPEFVRSEARSEDGVALQDPTVRSLLDVLESKRVEP